MDFSDLGGQQIAQAAPTATATMAPPSSGIDFSDLGGEKIEATPKEPQWSDLPKNIIAGLKETPETLKAIGKKAVAWPGEALESAGEIALGGNPLETPTVKNFTDLLTAPVKVAKDYGAGELLTGHPIDAAEKAKAQFIEHPIQTGILAAPLIAGAAKQLLPFAEGETGAVTLGGEGAEEEGAAAAAPKSPPVPEANYLQTLGARGVLNKAGVSSETLEQMTPQGVAPGDIGAKVAQALDADKVLESSSNGTFKNAAKALKSAGQDVDEAVNQINEAGVTPVHDLKVIEPIQSKYAEMMQSSRSAVRRLATQWKEAAQSLTQRAGEDGVLTLDDIRAEMKDVGNLFEKYERDSPQWKNNARIYGQLANIRDSMVDTIAQASNNPKLATFLKQANARYSLYSRILPDLKGAAAAEATGELEPSLSAMVSQEVKPLLSKLLLKAGGAQSKYGPALIDAAQRGQASLLVTHHILKQHDAEYARLVGDIEK